MSGELTNPDRNNSSFIIHNSTFLDTHAHLDQDEFDADRAAVIARARAAGVEAIVCPAVSALSAEAVVRLAEEHELWAAVGIHPNYTAEAKQDDWDRIVELAGNPRVVAIGETGLDRYRDYSPLQLQQEYFERHLQLACSRGLPVIIHCRDAREDMLPMLRAAAADGPLVGVLHAFSGTADFAAECLSLGLHVGFAGNVTYSNRKNDYLRDVAREIPKDRLLIETDSPYLVPQAFRGRVKRNEPAYVVRTAAFLAELRGVSVEQLAAATTANARRLFRLPVGQK
ncbi:MAG: TatD family hydrolase [Planctomycetes bacterium]|nr:TatD family hydrolase [Planctomycetota bacterium]